MAGKGEAQVVYETEVRTEVLKDGGREEKEEEEEKKQEEKGGRRVGSSSVLSR